jgi:HlyD family type I secretion membrane fusion protein
MAEQGTQWSVRRPVLLGTITLAFLVGGFGTWATQSELAGAVVTSGTVEIAQERQAIQHPDGGVVAEILVSEGSHVSEGDILLELDGADIASELSIVRGRLREIQARRFRLETERDREPMISFGDELVAAARENPDLQEVLDGQSNLFTARRETLDREVEQLERRSEQIRDQIEGLEAQRDALVEEASLIAEDLEAQESLLERGLAQSTRVLSLRREAVGNMGSIGEIEASIASARERATEIEISILQLSTTRREDAIAELREIRSEEQEVLERVVALERQLSRMQIRAPVSGIVYGLDVSGPQSVIRPADPIMHLVPEDKPLVVIARIGVADIDQAYVGQDVTLVFSAFDIRSTPELRGHVTRVSADAFEDETTGARYFEAESV